MKILLATTSAHKAREIAELLRDVPDLQLETLDDYPATEAPDEDGETMAQNARIKAEFYAQHFQTLVLADDSGLETDFLEGEPGVHSARWSQGSAEDRTRALLERLTDAPEDLRAARYRCAICLADQNGVPFQAEATCEGAIAAQIKGENGFGYDPIFEITLATGAPLEWVGKTMGEAPPEVKAAVSHRAQAVRELAKFLGILN